MMTHVRIDEKTNIPLGLILTILLVVVPVAIAADARYAKQEQVAMMQQQVQMIFEKLIPEDQRKAINEVHTH